jgi:hypothetical protein
MAPTESMREGYKIRSSFYLCFCEQIKMEYQPKQSTTISERRSQYPLNERLVVYNTESMQRMIENKSSNDTVPALNSNNPNTFVVNGVSILNKISVDSDTMMHRIIQRRQTHNRVERRRRDRMVSPSFLRLIILITLF